MRQLLLLSCVGLLSCGNCGTATCFDGTDCADGGFTGGGGGHSGGGAAGTGGNGVGGSSGTGGGGMAPCPTGTTCNVSCPNNGTTTVSGKVYDPAGKNPLYNAAVFVPSVALPPLPRGVLTGANACSCAALFPMGAYTATQTDEYGSFTLSNVPVGADVPLVIQIGKWRRAFHINVTQCQDNPQPDKSLKFLGTVPAGDTDDNIPDIAVSTGNADTLECLMRRIGLPASEYVAGAGGSGHVHVFSGGTTGGGGNNGVGKAESPSMAGAPQSNTTLWSTVDQLMPYDILLLSCEGGETYKANPAVLESYLNAGGRAFASHFHYAWFAGPLGTNQAYAAPTDWGTHLASWAAGGGTDMGPIGGILDTTLNGSTAAFPKGVSLQKWLANVGALGTDGVPAGELAIYQPRYNSTVTPVNAVSQPWISSDGSGMQGATMYLSFDTPTNAPFQPDGGPPQYCGRAVFSDLHVAGNPATNDSTPPPNGCDNVDLSPQEKALEFMLFDLSSCVSSDTVPPPPILQ
jgi:hypothetical protein